MPDVTPEQLIPYPVGSDRPTIPADMKRMADRLDIIESNQDASLEQVGALGAVLLDFTNPSVALPSAPADGDRIIALVGTGLGWQFIWIDDQAVWAFTGGAPLQATIFTNETRSANTYANLATTGPTITMPLGMGTIHTDITLGADISSAADGQSAWMAYSIDGDAPATATMDARGVQQNNGSNAHVRWMRRASFDSGAQLVAKYRGSGTGSANFADRQMTIIPAWLVP